MIARPSSRWLTWRGIFIVPVAAAVVHLIATFMAMADTRNAAYTRLTAALPANTMTVMDPVAPGHQPVPFLSSDARYSICRFDTAKGPITVRATLPDLGWTLGIFHADGSSAYFAAAAPGRPTVIALTIVPDDDRFLGLTPHALGKSTTIEPQLSVSAPIGLIVVRAPDKGAAYRAGAEAVLAQASCAARTY